jgi:Mrp family chromosome partitioning ATPase
MEFLIITIPSRAALEVAKKEIQTLKELGIPILGVLENMKTKKESQTRNEMNFLRVPYLGQIDYDEMLEETTGNANRMFQTAFARQLNAILDLKPSLL